MTLDFFVRLLMSRGKMDVDTISYTTLFWTLFLISYANARGIVGMSTRGPLDLSGEFNTSFTGHGPLTFLDYPQSDGPASRGRMMADSPVPFPSKQRLVVIHERNVNRERSHQENYEALWRNADVSHGYGDGDENRRPRVSA